MSRRGQQPPLGGQGSQPAQPYAQATPTALVPRAAQRGVLQARPSQEAEAETAARTSQAITDLLAGDGWGKGARGAAGWSSQARDRHKQATYYQFTPDAAAPGRNAAISKRTIRMVDAPVDPMEPPKVRHQRVKSKPTAMSAAPILRDRAAPLSAEDQLVWDVPPCVSNWKNDKGFTVGLDKRLAADGRNLREHTLGEGHAAFAEAMYAAERKAREEVATRAAIREQVQLKAKADTENKLMQMASVVHAARTGGAGKPGSPGSLSSGSSIGSGASLAEDSARGSRARGARGRSRSRSPARSARRRGGRSRSRSPVANDALAREKMRQEHARDVQRELRRGRAGKALRDSDRDISEKIALGQAMPQRLEGDAMYDSRLFSQAAGASSASAHDVYDKPWLARREATIYRPSAAGAGAAQASVEDLAAGGGRVFKPDVDFEGVDRSAPRAAGPVEFTLGLDDVIAETTTGHAGEPDSLAHIGRRGFMSAAAGGARGQGEPSHASKPSTAAQFASRFVKGST